MAFALNLQEHFTKEREGIVGDYSLGEQDLTEEEETCKKRKECQYSEKVSCN